MRLSDIQISFIIIILGAILFIPFLGAVHLFDWDEINFAECSREMIVTGNYSQVMINFQPFWEKPPVFFWMQVLSMKLFGVNEFAARFPNAIGGILSLLVLYHAGRKFFNHLFGMVWVLVYAGSFLPHFYFKSGIIDPWFNLFIFLSIILFVNYTSQYAVAYEKSKPKSYLIFSAVFMGLSILTKGPVALLIFGLCGLSILIWLRFKKLFDFKDVLIWILITTLTGSSWFIFEIVNGRYDMVKEFIIYQIRLFTTQDAGHGGPFIYHFIVLLVGCFPASVFAIKSFSKSSDDTGCQRYIKKWMLVLLMVVLILFSIVKTKIIHYSSLAYFPLTFLAAWSIFKISANKIQLNNWMKILIAFIGILLSLAIILLPIINYYKEEIIARTIIKDAFALENFKADIHWGGWELFIGIILFTGIIISLVLFKKKQSFFRAAIVLFISSLITVNLTAIIYVPKIEQYAQAAAIAFYKSLKDKDVYVETLHFKSYAHLFYANKQPPDNAMAFNQDWLLNGPVDKPVFFVTRINKIQEVSERYPHLKEIYRKNGFIFLKR
jgi:4-amino-4-deoxy-L-arabinose transferase-like glycosyltransferase